MHGRREEEGERDEVGCKLYQVNYSASLDAMWAHVETISCMEKQLNSLSANIID